MSNSSLAEQAYKVIKNDIIACELDPGMQMAQSQLVERYGLGITPIREALKRLEQEGLVQAIPRFGYVVAPITVADVEDIYELRLILEASAVRLAAQRISSEELARLQAQSGFTYQYHNRQSHREFLSRNTTFHAAVAAASGNKRLAQVVSKLLDDMARIFHLGLDLRDSAAEMTREHLDLVGAIADRDADQAERLLRGQIVTSRKRVLERLAGHIHERFVGEAPVWMANRSDRDRTQGGGS